MKPEFLRFILVGMINTLFYYLIFSILVFIQTDYRLAVLIASILGTLFSFFNFGRYVFNNQNKKLIIRFVSNSALIYFLNIQLVKTIYATFAFNLYVSGFIAIIPLTLLSYLINKFYVFK